jgi:hypothetical protein
MTYDPTYCNDDQTFILEQLQARTAVVYVLYELSKRRQRRNPDAIPFCECSITPHFLHVNFEIATLPVTLWYINRIIIRQDVPLADLLLAEFDRQRTKGNFVYYWDFRCQRTAMFIHPDYKIDTGMTGPNHELFFWLYMDTGVPGRYHQPFVSMAPLPREMQEVPDNRIDAMGSREYFDQYGEIPPLSESDYIQSDFELTDTDADFDQDDDLELPV